MLVSGADGRLLTHRNLPPMASHVGWTAGRLTYWRSNGQGRELVVYDPLTGAETFSKAYGENAEATLVDGGQMAVLDEAHGLEVWQLPAGKLAMKAECPMPATSTSGFENSPFASSQAMYGFVEVHGPAYSFDRKTGRRLWKAEIDNQRMRLHQPADLPILVFRNQRYQREGRTSRTFHSHLVLDSRDGRELHKNENNRSSHFLYQTKVDLEKATVEVLSSREKIALYYKERPKVEKENEEDKEPPKP